MFCRIVIFVYALIFSLSVNGQNYWISTSVDWGLGISDKIISTKDGGYVSVGNIKKLLKPNKDSLQYEITKFNAIGIITWKYSEIINPKVPTIALNISEIDDGIFTFYNSSSKTKVIKLSSDGNHISTQELNINANDITTVEGDNFIIMHQVADTVKVSKFDSNLKSLWTISLPKIQFPSINRTYMDLDGNYRFVARHNTRISSVFDIAIGLDGMIKRNKEFAYDPSGKGSTPGIFSGLLDPKSMIIINGENDVNSSLLRRYEVENLTVTKTFNIFSYISFVEQVKAYDNHIYLMGRQRGNNFSALMVFNSDLELINYIKMDSIFNNIISKATGSSISNMELVEDGILFSGKIKDSNESSLRLDGFINRKGELTIVKEQQINSSLKIDFYPNPASEHVMVTWDGWTPSLLKVMSVDGNILHTQHISTESKEAKVDLTLYSNSIMIIEASSEMLKESQVIIKK